MPNLGRFLALVFGCDNRMTIIFILRACCGFEPQLPLQKETYNIFPFGGGVIPI